jgi:hypothetical protein
LERLSGAKVRRSSWQYQIVLAFLLSPYTSRLLHRMKSPLLLMKQLSPPCFFSNEKPERLIGDKAYDSDPLDERLAVEYGIEMISSHRFNRHRSRTQDGRSLRRYKIGR